MSNTQKHPIPCPLFDAMEYLQQTNGLSFSPQINPNDYQHAMVFLLSYQGSQGTFNSYRREIERLLQWSNLIREKSIANLRREDIEAFLGFCQSPPKSWISIKKSPKFMVKDGLRIPNPEWKPFVVTVSKSAHQQGVLPNNKHFSLSQGAIKETFAILSSFYNYLLQEEYVLANPVALIRQKSKFIQRQQIATPIRRLSELQWDYVLSTATVMAEVNPKLHERTLFMITALYAMYLRISELTANDRWQPKMCDFYRDSDHNWWFTTVGKGNKKRQIAVSNAMLAALKRWRKHLELTSLPSPADDSPLLPLAKGKGALSSTTYVREIVQTCFDQAKLMMQTDGHHEEAETLNEATVHWLRHTGISDDVKHRPREHVRDDAGHSSGATTDKYIDVELRARHASAKKKKLN